MLQKKYEDQPFKGKWCLDFLVSRSFPTKKNEVPNRGALTTFPTCGTNRSNFAVLIAAKKRYNYEINMTRGWGTLPCLLFRLVFCGRFWDYVILGVEQVVTPIFFTSCEVTEKFMHPEGYQLFDTMRKIWNMLIIYCHTRLDAIHYHTIHITNKICNKVIFFLHNHITYTGSIDSVRFVVSKNFITVRQSNFVSSNVPKPPGRHEPNLSRWWVIPWWTRPGQLEGWGSMVATEMGGSTTITTYWV